MTLELFARSFLLVLLQGVFIGPLFARDPAAPLRREGHEVLLAQPVTFETGTARLQPQSEVGLTLIRDYLETQSSITLLRVEGHVAEGADEQARLALSLERSLAVARWLVTRGVDCKRLLPVGFGSSKPRYSDGQPGNERIQFLNAALRGRSIGGMPLEAGGMPAAWSCLTEAVK